MSLEDAIKANTAAVLALTAAMQQGAPAAPKAPASPKEVKGEAKPVAATPATTSPANASALNKDGECPAYAPVKLAFLNLCKLPNGRELALAAIAPLTELKSVKAGEDVPGRYASLLERIQKAAPPPPPPAASVESSAASLV